MAQLELFAASQTYTTRKGGQIGHRVGHGELFPEVTGASLLTVSRQEVATVAHAVAVAVAVAKVGAPITPTTPKARAKARTKARKAREAKKDKAPVDHYGHLPAHIINGKASEAVRHYRLAHEAEVKGNRRACARHFGKMAKILAPAVRLSAKTGSLTRRALGLSNPSANLLKYSTGKSEAEHFKQSREERNLGRGVYIAEHIRRNGWDVDAFAAADAGFGRAFVKLLEAVRKGNPAPFRLATEEGTKDAQLVAFICGISARMYREEVYGRHRSNSKNSKHRKPAPMGDHDPIDYRQDLGAYQLDADSRNQIISEFSHILSTLKKPEGRDPVTGKRLDPMRLVYAFTACYGGNRAGRPKAGEVVSDVKPHHILGVSRATANRELGKGGPVFRAVFGHMLHSIEDLNIIGRRLEMVRLTYRFCTLMNALHSIRDRA